MLKKLAGINDVKTLLSFDKISNVNWCFNSIETEFTKIS